MDPARILFVDDEPSLILTMPPILRHHGYNVTAVATVSEALTQITSTPFDVLISDLNIGHPGDGFTVVSAMRRTQPTCVTLIITGYPGFDTALEAIRNQVDDYLIKPAAIPALVNLIEEKLKSPKSGKAAPTKRISQILRESVFEIAQRVLKEMKANPAFAAIPITDEQRIEFLPRTIENLADMLDAADSDPVKEEAIHTSKLRGLKLYQLGYNFSLLVPRTRILEQVIYDVIHEHLLSLNLSYFIFDLKHLNAILSIQLEHILLGFLNAEQRLGRQEEQQS